MVIMKKLIITFLLIIAAGGAAWFFLLFPEEISQERLTEDFNAHRAAYVTIGTYLRKRNITTEIDDIPIAGRKFKGIEKEDSEEYGQFMDAIYEIMQEDHDVIRSDGLSVEFVYRSTGGRLTKLYGSVIYNGFDKVEGKITVPLADGWHLYLAQK